MDFPFWRLFLVCSLATSEAALAQTPPDAGSTPQQFEEELLVTGSRVPRKDLTSPGPVVLYSREDIATSGTASLGDFLQLMPWQSGGFNRQFDGASDGSSYVALRNLGPRRTLVLVDGQRWVNSGAGGGFVYAPSVDLNTIPAAAVDRIEILKDGASAVYGSDAVGGVVNIITRRRMNGVEAEAYSGISTHGDGVQVQVNGTGGASNDRGGFLVSLGYFHGSSVLSADRPWSQHAVSYDFVTGRVDPWGSTAVPAGSALVDPAKCPTQLCQRLNGAYPGAGPTMWIADGNPGMGVPVVTDPATGQTWRKLITSGPANDLYNFNPQNNLVSPTDRVSIFANGDYRITDFARARLQASWVESRASTGLPASALFTSTTGSTIDPSNPYNPFGVPITFASKTLLELGPRAAQPETQTVNLTAGFDGTVESTFWSLSFRYGRSSSTLQTESLDKTKVSPSLGPAHQDQNGVWQCGAPGTSIPGCTPVNLFGYNSVTPQMAQALGPYSGVTYDWSQLLVFDAQLSRDLFRLAADRSAGVALGYQLRRESAAFQPDPFAVAGNSLGYAAKPLAGSFTVNEAYLELLVPVVSNVPFADDIEAQAVGRWSHYSTYGTDWTYMLGARWRPIRGLTLRGTWSTAFRAPAIDELYTGQVQGFSFAQDPCANIPASNAALRAQCAAGPGGANAVNNGGTNSTFPTISGGNPALQPETATTATIGAVIELLKGFSLAIDYYHIRLEDTITRNIGTSVILAGCYPASTGSGAEPSSKDCGLITRDPASGMITQVVDIFQNAGSLVTNGLDVALRYSLPTGAGRFRFLLDGNYLFKQDFALPSGKVVRSAGNYDLSVINPYLGVTPRVRFNAGIDYGLGSFTAGVGARYTGGFDECAPPGGNTSLGRGLCADQNKDPSTGVPYPSHGVASYTAFDLYVSYALKSSLGTTSFAVGVRNVFDAAPPAVYASALTYADVNYEFVGRYVYGRIVHKF